MRKKSLLTLAFVATMFGACQKELSQESRDTPPVAIPIEKDTANLTVSYVYMSTIGDVKAHWLETIPLPEDGANGTSEIKALGNDTGTVSLEIRARAEPSTAFTFVGGYGDNYNEDSAHDLGQSALVTVYLTDTSHPFKAVTTQADGTDSTKHYSTLAIQARQWFVLQGSGENSLLTDRRDTSSHWKLEPSEILQQSQGSNTRYYMGL